MLENNTTCFPYLPITVLHFLQVGLPEDPQMLKIPHNFVEE